MQVSNQRRIFENTSIGIPPKEHSYHQLQTIC